MNAKQLRFSILVSGVFILFAMAGPVYAAQGVEAVDAAWMTALKANDIEGLVACYVPDAIGWFPNAPQARGSEAIRAAYKTLLAGNTVTDVKFSDTHYETVGNHSVGWGTFSLTLTPKAGGSPVVMTGRFTEVAEQREGRWVYIVDHASADPRGADEAGK